VPLSGFWLDIFDEGELVVHDGVAGDGLHLTVGRVSRSIPWNGHFAILERRFEVEERKKKRKKG
jgi:hypothetical protein